MDYFPDTNLSVGDRVKVECDNPIHGDYKSNGKTGTIVSQYEDIQEDHARFENKIEFDDGSSSSILHYNLTSLVS